MKTAEGEPRANYLSSRMKMPAAIARIAMIMGSPEKLKCSNWINPVTMSHMLSNIKPMFLVSFISFISLRKNCDSLIGISFFVPHGIPTYKTQSG